MQERDDTTEIARLEAELAVMARCVSHDLRQPLHVISGYVELISFKYRGLLDARGVQLIDKAMDGVQRLNDMIDALVGLMRLEAHAPRAEVDAGAVLAEVLIRLGPELAACGGSIERGSLPIVVANADQLALVIEHLVRNVLRFPGDGAPHGRLVAHAQDGFWRFEMHDQGKGIDPRLHASIFEPFGRGLDPRAGIGMGLAICRKILTLHGGGIGVESTPGQGACFWFTLPR
ncbi:MAG: ATP-binding protein [Pseudomonadota bacterium]